MAAALTAPATLPRLPLAVVFDMDGLLFDTEALYREAIVTVAARRGHDSASPVFANLVGLPWPLSRRLLVEHFGAETIGKGTGERTDLAKHIGSKTNAQRETSA